MGGSRGAENNDYNNSVVNAVAVISDIKNDWLCT